MRKNDGQDGYATHVSNNLDRKDKTENIEGTEALQLMLSLCLAFAGDHILEMQ